MYKTMLLSATLSAIWVSAIAQGLIFESDAFEKGQQLEVSRDDKVPSSISMKSYTPYVLTQQNATCVAYSLAIARTMLIAKERELLTKDEITVNCISPHWIYYRNKDSYDTECNSGLSIEKAMEDILNNGAPRMAYVEYPDYYPFKEVILCNYYPPAYSEDKVEALNWTIDNVYRISNLDGIKLALSKGMPVVVGMAVPNSFEAALRSPIWQPSTGDRVSESMGHAMVVVGYDDSKYGGAIEIMNSWGTVWGDGGFIWIRYGDFTKYTLGAYALEKEIRFGKKPTDEVAVDSLLSRDIQMSKAIDLHNSDTNEYHSMASKFTEFLKRN